MKIVIAADHGGFQLKNILADWLRKEKYDIIDAGNEVYDPLDDYPDFAMKAAKIISKGEAQRGIIICGSGVGACIAANKFKDVRASVCHDTYSAHQGVEHDDMNAICIGARIIGENLAKEIAAAFLKAEFIKEEKYIRRLNKIKSIES